MSASATERFAKLEANRPALHHWGGVLRTGGFEDNSFKRAFEFLNRAKSEGPLRVVETGAGLTTLASLCLEPERHVSICPEAGTIERIFAYCAENDVPSQVYTNILGISEEVFPQFAMAEPQKFTFSIIDGGHNFPTVWLDFIYSNLLLSKDGYLLVDDIELYSCRTLALYLKHNVGWQDLGGYPAKFRVFKKLTDTRFEGEFGSSPFVRSNMF